MPSCCRKRNVSLDEWQRLRVCAALAREIYPDKGVPGTIRSASGARVASIEVLAADVHPLRRRAWAVMLVSLAPQASVGRCSARAGKTGDSTSAAVGGGRKMLAFCGTDKKLVWVINLAISQSCLVTDSCRFECTRALGLLACACVRPSGFFCCRERGQGGGGYLECLWGGSTSLRVCWIVVMLCWVRCGAARWSR